jgi:hypothetical protein
MNILRGALTVVTFAAIVGVNGCGGSTGGVGDAKASGAEALAMAVSACSLSAPEPESGSDSEVDDRYDSAATKAAAAAAMDPEFKDAATALSKWATASRELSNLDEGDPKALITQVHQAFRTAQKDREAACRLVAARQ